MRGTGVGVGGWGGGGGGWVRLQFAEEREH